MQLEEFVIVDCSFDAVQPEKHEGYRFHQPTDATRVELPPWKRMKAGDSNRSQSESEEL